MWGCNKRYNKEKKGKRRPVNVLFLTTFEKRVGTQ